NANQPLPEGWRFNATEAFRTELRVLLNRSAAVGTVHGRDRYHVSFAAGCKTENEPPRFDGRILLAYGADRLFSIQPASRFSRPSPVLGGWTKLLVASSWLAQPGSVRMWSPSRLRPLPCTTNWSRLTSWAISRFCPPSTDLSSHPTGHWS